MRSLWVAEGGKQAEYVKSALEDALNVRGQLSEPVASVPVRSASIEEN